jgi:hypothetical protein
MDITINPKPNGQTQVRISDAALEGGHVEFKLTSPTEVTIHDNRMIPDDKWDELLDHQREALRVWNQGSWDTTQMMKAVDAAVRHVEQRIAGSITDVKNEVWADEEGKRVTIGGMSLALQFFSVRDGTYVVPESACVCVPGQTRRNRHTCPVHGACLIPDCGCDGTPHP